MVGISIPYSVPWPPGAVARIPADQKSAMLLVSELLSVAIRRGAIIMSNSEVTPKTRACSRAAAL